MPKIKSRQRMGYISLAFHWTMILCTLGLWYPIYASRRRARSTVTYVPASYVAAPPQQPAGPPPPPAYGQPPRR
jgi:hypothetical protein